MKKNKKSNKKIYISIAIIIVLALVSLTYYYLHNYNSPQIQKKPQVKKTIKAQAQPEPKSHIQKIHNYCLITYKLSKDSGKTWKKITLNSGDKPTTKDECWQKYSNLLDDFQPSIDKNGNWKGKDKGVISAPSMNMSENAINPKKSLSKKTATATTKSDDKTKSNKDIRNIKNTNLPKDIENFRIKSDSHTNSKSKASHNKNKTLKKPKTTKEPKDEG